MKNKKVIIGIVIAVIFIIAIIVGIVIMNMPKEKPEEVLNTYFSAINNEQYEEMYTYLSSSSKQSISQEDFVTRNQNIYEGIDSSNINITVKEVTNEDKKKKVSYSEEMVTSAGTISFDNIAYLVKEDKTYKLEWSSSLIFPELRRDYKVRVETLSGKRGSILDRNGNPLAYDGTISQVGIVPGKLGDNREQNISKISELTGVSVETINNFLSASYVKDDTFVPIRKVAKDDTELKEQLLQIVDLLLKNTQDALDNKNIKLYVSDEAKKYILEKGTDLKYGARPLRRAIQRYIEDEISEMILKGELEQSQTVEVTLEEEQLKFTSK